MPMDLFFDEDSELNFTRDIRDLVQNLIPNPGPDEIDPCKNEDFLYEDSAEKIYRFLTETFRHHGFGDYLKRYIYCSAEMDGSYEDIPDEEYQDVIIHAFRDNFTDFSFYQTNARGSDVVRDWLTRKVVSRETVMLLGFGLNMKPDDVSELLFKGLHEAGLDPKEPLEAACSYCFRKGYSFPRFKKIWEQFDPDHPSVPVTGSHMDGTSQYQAELDAVDTDGDLLLYLYNLPLCKGTKRQSLTARAEFDALYSSVQEGLIRRSVLDEVAETGRYTDREYNPEKSAEERKPDGAAEIENVLYAFVPKTPSNNFAPLRQSTLKDLFYEKRLNRQHIGEIRKGKAPVTRFDLITMCFLDYDLKRGSKANVMQEHYDAFIGKTNAVLKKCNMDELYPANPYECFVMLCMQTESPLEVYSEIWGMSYGVQ